MIGELTMDSKQWAQIDPALGLIKEFSKVSLGTTKAIQQLRQQVIFKDGALPAKIKALIAMVSGINARCEPCLIYYTVQAKTLGADEIELGEVLAVVTTMGGCVGEMWALKAYKAFKEQNTLLDTCCEHTKL